MSNKIRVGIYIDQDIWNQFSLKVMKQQVLSGMKPSISRYLEDMISSKIEPMDIKPENFTGTDKIDPVKERAIEKPNERSEDEMIAETQKKIDKIRAENNIETKKGPVKANKAMSNFFSPQPKGGKK